MVVNGLTASRVAEKLMLDLNMYLCSRILVKGLTSFLDDLKYLEISKSQGFLLNSRYLVSESPPNENENLGRPIRL